MTMMMIMKLWDPHFVFCLSIFFENESSYLILIFFSTILIFLITKLVGYVEDEEQVCWENIYQEEKE